MNALLFSSVSTIIVLLAQMQRVHSLHLYRTAIRDAQSQQTLDSMTANTRSTTRPQRDIGDIDIGALNRRRVSYHDLDRYATALFQAVYEATSRNDISSNKPSDYRLSDRLSAADSLSNTDFVSGLMPRQSSLIKRSGRLFKFWKSGIKTRGNQHTSASI